MRRWNWNEVATFGPCCRYHWVNSAATGVTDPVKSPSGPRYETLNGRPCILDYSVTSITTSKDRNANRHITVGFSHLLHDLHPLTAKGGLERAKPFVGACQRRPASVPGRPRRLKHLGRRGRPTAYSLRGALTSAHEWGRGGMTAAAPLLTRAGTNAQRRVRPQVR